MISIATRHVLMHPLCILAALLASLGLVVASGVAIKLWQPALERETAATADVDRLADRLRVLRLRADMAETFASRERDVQDLEERLKSGRDTPQLVRDIEGLAEKSGAALLQFSSRKSAKEAAGIETTIFEFALKGSYQGLKEFLTALARMPEFVVVERTVFERVDGGVRVRVIAMRRASREA